MQISGTSALLPGRVRGVEELWAKHNGRWPCSSRGTLLVKGISLLNTTLTRTGFPTEFKEWSKLAQDPESWRARVWPG